MTSNKLHFKLTVPRLIMIAFFLFTLVVMLFRLFTGMSVTNLNDQWTWGLWIIVDLTSITLAGAGFSMAFMSHILNIDKYKQFSRRALLMSMCGYVFTLIVLFIEIGRWDNFYQPLLNPNWHSPMTEVFLCILAYFVLQCVEVLDVALEKYSFKGKQMISKIMPVVFVVACLVPFGHQASLGALYLAMPGKMFSLWNTPAMPWMFLISAFFVGFAVVALEYTWASKHYKKERDTASLGSLLRVGSFIMLGYFVIKIIDLAVRGQFGVMFGGSKESIFFIVECVLLLIPMIMGLIGKVKTVGTQVIYSVLTVVGVVMIRFNVIFTGMAGHLGGGYIPSWVEVVMSIGFLCFVVLLYLFAIENLPFYGLAKKAGQKDDGHGTFVQAIESK